MGLQLARLRMVAMAYPPMADVNGGDGQDTR